MDCPHSLYAREQARERERANLTGRRDYLRCLLLLAKLSRQQVEEKPQVHGHTAKRDGF